MVSPRIEDTFVKVIFGWGILAAMFTSGPVKVNVFVGANSKSNSTSNPWWLSGGTSNNDPGAAGFGDVNISAILNSFQMGYDKRVRPNYGGQAVTVGVTMYVLSISELSEVQMDFTLDMYFRQFWQDPRLSFERRPGLDKLVVGAEYIKLIWVPDTFFVNEKTAYFHDATTDNQFVRIFHTGDILRSIRLTITASCPMDLQYFPMDSQLCYIEIESFGYTMSDIRYKWNDGLNSVQVSGDVSLPQFKVLGHRQKTIEASLSTGNYSRLACEIQFVRSMGYYLIQIYIPSSLIVVISWVSFWLNRGATPARVGLGVTTVLTMTTLISSTNSALPKISYVKSIDVYLAACFFMVFASLLEYASVGYMAKRIQMRKNRFLAIQKMAEQKKNEALHASNANINDATNLDLGPGIPKQTEIRINMHDPLMRRGHTNLMRGGQGGSTSRLLPGALHGGPVSRAPDELLLHQPPPLLHCKKNLQKMGGISPSDIDKYSRILFPVSFICFNLMYWIIYLNISEDVVPDLVLLGSN